MKPISQTKHKALIAALQTLEELSVYDLQPASAEDDVQRLQLLFEEYQQLMASLETCISAYDELYKQLRVDVLAPKFRMARSTMDRETLAFQLLLQSFAAVRSY